MPGPWITSADLLQALADRLGTDVGQLSGRFQRMAAQAVQLGYEDLVSVLCPMGYSVDQLDQWASRQVENTFQGLYRLGLLVGDEGRTLLELDRTKFLAASTAIVIGGRPVAPAAPEGSDIGGIVPGRTAGGAALDEAFRGRPEFPW